MSRILIASLSAASCALPALAQPSISWSTIDGGGASNLTGGSISLSGTVGQPDAAQTPLTGGSLSLTGGFWQDALFPTCPCLADFDGSGGTPDASDIDAFFVAWLAGEPLSDADCSGGTPDSSDIDAFFTQWQAGGC